MPAVDAMFWVLGRGASRIAHGLRSMAGVADDADDRRSVTSSSSSSSSDDLEAALSTAADPPSNNPASAAPTTTAATTMVTDPSGRQKPPTSDDKKQPEPAQTERGGRDGAKSRRPAGSAGASPSLAAKPATRLMDLPPELQLMIVRNLDFGDVERLRRTSRFYRTFISPKTVREVFGARLKSVLLAHCYLCLRSDPARTSLLWADWQDPRYPLASKCIDCAVQRGELTVGRKVALGNFASVWVCRWCGYPVLQDGAAWNQPEFHRECYNGYNHVLLSFFLLGFVQFFIVIVGAALLWTYFRHLKMVLVPSIIDFILAIFCIFLLVLRGAKTRTYHWTLFIEMVCLALWIPPLYAIVGDITSSGVGISRSTMAVLVFCGLNMFFRLLNVVGNLFLMCEYKLWRQNKPRVAPARRLLNRLVAGFIFWTYPQSLEQEFPGRYRC